MGKSSINGPFSMAKSNNQRVTSFMAIRASFGSFNYHWNRLNRILTSFASASFCIWQVWWPPWCRGPVCAELLDFWQRLERLVNHCAVPRSAGLGACAKAQSWQNSMELLQGLVRAETLRPNVSWQHRNCDVLHFPCQTCRCYMLFLWCLVF